MTTTPAAEPGDEHPDLALARSLAAAVTEVCGVADLDGSVGGVFATWRGGGRQVGVRVSRNHPDHVAIRVVASDPAAVAGLGERVRAAATAAADRDLRNVDVHVADVHVPHGPDEAPASTT